MTNFFSRRDRDRDRDRERERERERNYESRDISYNC